MGVAYRLQSHMSHGARKWVMESPRSKSEGRWASWGPYRRTDSKEDAGEQDEELYSRSKPFSAPSPAKDPRGRAKYNLLSRLLIWCVVMVIHGLNPELRAYDYILKGY